MKKRSREFYDGRVIGQDGMKSGREGFFEVEIFEMEG